MPILVGGTHYYTQSLLFQDALADEPALDLKENSTHFPILDEPTETILAKLKEVDPIMANRWHPNERRKIQRSLEIYLRTGKPASQIYDEQRKGRDTSLNVDGDANDVTSGLRFPTLVFWVHASKEELYPRLDARVDKMLKRGLLSEVQELTNFRIENEARMGCPVDQGRGIWVSIGYKEFLSYQHALAHNASDLEKTKATAIEKTQAATRQYANRQIKWIRIKLLNALFGACQKNRMFLVDGSDLSQWKQQVVDPAMTITEKFLSSQSLPDPTTLSVAAAEMLTPKRAYDLGQRPDLWMKKVCETCGTVAVTENDWDLHVKSRTHRRAVGAKKKQEHTKESKTKDHRAVEADIVDVLETYLETFDDDK